MTLVKIFALVMVVSTMEFHVKELKITRIYYVIPGNIQVEMVMEYSPCSIISTPYYVSPHWVLSNK